MKQLQKENIRRIASFSARYRAKVLSSSLAFEKAGSWDEVRRDWWLALVFFFDRAFYQGRRDKLSFRFEMAALCALDEVLGSPAELKRRKLQEVDCWLERKHWEAKDNPLWEALGRKYRVDQGKPCGVGKGQDRKMVLDSLRFAVRECKDWNIVEDALGLVAAGKIKGAYNRLNKIIGVGPKIASFFLRDLVDIYGLEGCLGPEDYSYCHPIDTWVQQVAEKLGLALKKKQQYPLEDANILVSACLESETSPISFNQGAWYLGAHSFDILLDNLPSIRAPLYGAFPELGTITDEDLQGAKRLWETGLEEQLQLLERSGSD